MSDNVIELGTLGRHMSCDEVLAMARRHDWQDVAVVGFDKDGDPVVFTSRIHLGDLMALLKVTERLVEDSIMGPSD